MADDKVSMFKPKEIDYKPAAYLSYNQEADSQKKILNNPIHPGSISAQLSGMYS